MTSNITRLRALVRAVIAVSALALLSGCMSSPYLDTSLKEVDSADRVAVAKPRPVQLLFEFQTKGVQNGTATDLLKDTVLETAQSSGLFTQVGPAAAPDGSLLHVIINNIPLTDDAFAKGFMTGFTFGLIGTTAGDGYVCTIEYLPGGSTQKLVQTTRDAIYVNFGAKAAPQNVEKMKDLTTAVKTMARRVVANGLNQIAKDPEFPK